MKKFELKTLPYDKGAISFLSPETFDYHYSKHHLNYVNKLNELLANEPQLQNATLEEIVMKSSGPVFNNAAQVWNHDFYWSGLSPSKVAVNPAFKGVIEKQWGSFDQFSKEFETKTLTLFGSGWSWLAFHPREKSLQILQTQNAENPLRSGYIPLLTCDVWEHAYYIDYRNDRAQYFRKFWDAVNWNWVESNYDRAIHMKN